MTAILARPALAFGLQRLRFQGDTSSVGADMPPPKRSLSDLGASAVEYALIVAAVALLLIPAAITLTKVLDHVLTSNCEQTATQNGSADPAADCQ
jgi:Flp pilus assembly pilin Flp